MVCDAGLARQLTYVKTFYEVVRSACAAAKLRSGSVGQANPAEQVPISQDAATALHRLRTALSQAQDQQRLPFFNTIFDASKKAELHLPILDTYVAPKKHAQQVLKLGHSELSVWGRCMGVHIEGPSLRH